MRHLARPFKDWYTRSPNGCWPWLGAVNSSGYANKYFGGRMETAHRISWLIHRGPIPSGMLVLHSCDVRRCVNPKHLFLGTQLDNLRDMATKGRARSPLTEDDVMFIKALRRSGETLSFIGAVIGITKEGVHNIVTRRTWRHVA